MSAEWAQSAVMSPEEFRDLFLQSLRDPATISAFGDIFKPIVDSAVAEAVKAKDEQISRLEAELLEQKEKYNDLEQYSRKNCVNISGLPETPNEDLTSKVIQLGTALGVPISANDIDTAHRLGNPARSRNRTCIVKFVRFDKRQEVYAARKKLRDDTVRSALDTTGDGILITENLTRANQEVMYAARQLKRGGKLFAVWSDAGRMKVRTHRDAPTKIIKKITDLRQLVGDDPALVPATTAVRPERASAAPAGGSEGWQTVRRSERQAGQNKGR